LEHAWDHLRAHSLDVLENGVGETYSAAHYHFVLKHLRKVKYFCKQLAEDLQTSHLLAWVLQGLDLLGSLVQEIDQHDNHAV
jgi:hypothetical protein